MLLKRLQYWLNRARRAAEGTNDVWQLIGFLHIFDPFRICIFHFNFPPPCVDPDFLIYLRHALTPISGPDFRPDFRS